MSPALNTHLLSATPVSNDFNYWTLTEFGSGQHQNRCITLPGRRISIGRSPDAGIVVNDGSVSKLHAEIYFENGEPFVRDLDSRNGTFINCRPIRIDAVREGDLLQFANAVYRVGYVRQEAPKTIEQGISIWANSLLLFDELISKRTVIPFYQPIIDLRTNHKLGFEVLARLANDLGCNPLAEGVETEEESVVCKQMGFCFGQGYLYGKPAPFESQQATP